MYHMDLWYWWIMILTITKIVVVTLFHGLYIIQLTGRFLICKLVYFIHLTKLKNWNHICWNISQMTFIKKCKTIKKINASLEEPGHTWVPELGWMWISVFHWPPKAVSPLISSSSGHSSWTPVWTFSQIELPQPQVCVSLIAVYCIGFISLMWKGGAVAGVLDTIPATHSHWTFCSVWRRLSPVGLISLCSHKSMPIFLFLPFLFCLCLPVPPLNLPNITPSPFTTPKSKPNLNLVRLISPLIATTPPIICCLY